MIVSGLGCLFSVSSRETVGYSTFQSSIHKPLMRTTLAAGQAELFQFLHCHSSSGPCSVLTLEHYDFVARHG
jgi:hypothetical protein